MLKAPGSDSEHDRVVESIKEDIESFAGNGLRTLLFAYREIEVYSDEKLH